MNDDKQYACKTCGSTNVRRDAWAEWNREEQRCVMGEVYDQGYCMACGEERNLEEKPIEDPAYPLSDWQYEVKNGDTILGYAEWLEHKMESATTTQKKEVPCEG